MWEEVGMEQKGRERKKGKKKDDKKTSLAQKENQKKITCTMYIHRKT